MPVYQMVMMLWKKKKKRQGKEIDRASLGWYPFEQRPRRREGVVQAGIWPPGRGNKRNAKVLTQEWAWQVQGDAQRMVQLGGVNYISNLEGETTNSYYFLSTYYEPERYILCPYRFSFTISSHWFKYARIEWYPLKYNINRQVHSLLSLAGRCWSLENCFVRPSTERRNRWWKPPPLVTLVLAS